MVYAIKPIALTNIEAEDDDHADAQVALLGQCFPCLAIGSGSSGAGYQQGKVISHSVAFVISIRPECEYRPNAA